MSLASATSDPCSACPWRTENHGQPHPHGWFSAKNRKRLWAKLRAGEQMSCHPTDPENEVPEGQTPVPDHVQPRECTGALVLVQREVMRFQKIADDARTAREALRCYRLNHPRGMTKGGLQYLVSRAIFDGTALGNKHAMARPNLGAAVSHTELEPWNGEP